MAGRFMDGLRRFFTLEEESYSSGGLDSDSLERGDGDPGKTKGAAPSPAAPYPGRGRANLVSIPAPKKQEIVVLEPTSFADAREIAEALKLKKCILLNMRKTKDNEMSRRIVDFLSGISYALEGNSQKVADQIFLFTPGHMEIIIAGEHQDAPRADDMVAGE